MKELPTRLMLRPSPRRQLGLLAISTVFVAIGVMMIRDGEWTGWLVAGFFGLGVVIFLINLIPGASYLVLRPEGFRYRSLFRSGSARWDDVEGFRVTIIGSSAMVCWNYAPSYQGQRLGRRLAKGMAGAEAALPDTYGRRADELASLLDDWRLRHSAASDRAVRPTED